MSLTVMLLLYHPLLLQQVAHLLGKCSSCALGSWYTSCSCCQQRTRRPVHAHVQIWQALMACCQHGCHPVAHSAQYTPQAASNTKMHMRRIRIQRIIQTTHVQPTCSTCPHPPRSCSAIATPAPASPSTLQTNPLTHNLYLPHHTSLPSTNPTQLNSTQQQYLRL
jgi:hypothetical protein